MPLPAGEQVLERHAAAAALVERDHDLIDLQLPRRGSQRILRAQQLRAWHAHRPAGIAEIADHVDPRGGNFLYRARASGVEGKRGTVRSGTGGGRLLEKKK